MLYALLLHFRVLLDFFYRPPRLDDCSVRHFRVLPEFADAYPEQNERAPDGALSVSDHLNKRLAHITAERWRSAPPGMEYYEAYFPGIDRLITAFEEALPNDLRDVLVNEKRQIEHRNERQEWG
jgi:hypothetical protein